MTANDETRLTCPKCGETEQENFFPLFPMVIFKIIDEKNENDFKTLVAKTRRFIKYKHIVPILFRCKKCRQHFKLNNNGKEFISKKFNKLCCPNPECNFNEFGSMTVYGASIKPPLPIRSKGWLKTYFYDGNNFVNEFQCPKCAIEFFVDKNGEEYITR